MAQVNTGVQLFLGTLQKSSGVSAENPNPHSADLADRSALLLLRQDTAAWLREPVPFVERAGGNRKTYLRLVHDQCTNKTAKPSKLDTKDPAPISTD